MGRQHSFYARTREEDAVVPVQDTGDLHQYNIKNFLN
jgi:hypothetical protein